MNKEKQTVLKSNEIITVVFCVEIILIVQCTTKTIQMTTREKLLYSIHVRM